ncbi:MAG: 3-dehydroquinate synthase [Candidatus Kapabacteria bacterium]|nr:3-dehydroquinate synthase [Ignavibacteriota bacterium]MCW5886154.1 3-dehydroquinate synthase [Candidatus Kapabacteria bacterium]
MSEIKSTNHVYSFCDIESVLKFFNNPDYFCIIDSNVVELFFSDLKINNQFVIESIEKNKNLDQIALLLSELIVREIERSVTIVGIGGGIVCDIAGFIASIYKRGTNLILVPTSLLAMVDAAIGGKNGINHNEIKNSIGCFKIPDYILISIDFLDNLPDKEVRNGIAELIKISLVANAILFEILSELSVLNITDFKKQPNLKSIIELAVDTKIEIVSQDLYDNGIRHILNFGHTIAHALELRNEISHGQAVAYGIYAAAAFSRELKILSGYNFERISKILQNYGFVTDFDFDTKTVLNDLNNDKKIYSGKIREIFLESIGKFKFMNLSFEEYGDLLNDLR